LKKISLSFLLIGLFFILVSCSSIDSSTKKTYKDENLSLTINTNGFEQKEFEIEIQNNSNKDILVLITEAKVLTKDGDSVNIMKVADALSTEHSIKITNLRLKSKAVYKQRYVAIGYVRKQILEDEFVLLPWIDSNNFKLSIPYIVENKKHIVEISY